MKQLVRETSFHVFHVGLMRYRIINLKVVIPSEAKGSRFEIVTPVFYEKAMRCAGTSLGLIVMIVQRDV